MKTVAERKGNRYILRGTKQFISLGSVSRLAFVLKDRGEPYAIASSMAKAYVAEICERVCLGAIQVFGGSGYMKDLPLERWYQDARAFQIYEDTSEIQRMIISRAIAKGSLPETS